MDESTLSFDRIPCWLDVRPSLLADRECQTFEQVKTTINIRGLWMTEGRLVSVSGFGFLVSLRNGPYEQGRIGGTPLWPAMAKNGFPHLPKAKRARSQIDEPFDIAGTLARLLTRSSADFE